MLGIPLYRLEHRPKLLRAACGALGLALVACMVAGTLRGIDSIYRDQRRVEDLKLHLPSQPPPPFPEGEDGEKLRARQRFLLYVLLMPEDFGTGQWPFLAREFDLEWPRDREKTFEWSFQAAEGLHAQSLRLKGPRRHDRGLDLEIECHSLSRGSLLGGVFEETGSFSIAWREARQLLGVMDQGDSVDWRAGLSSGWWTLLPRVVPSRYNVQYVACRVAFDDPLREAGVSGLLRDSEKERNSRKLMRRSEERRLGWTPAFEGGGWWLFGYIGRSFFGVLAAAALISQVFRMRALAFPVTLIVLIFLLIGLDHHAVAHHASRAADAGTDLETRALALDALQASFFFRATAAAAAESVAHDPAAPEILRNKASEAAMALHGD